MFPVFAKARGKARQIAYLSNLKQLGTGIMMYTQDHDEGLPPVNYGACGTPNAYSWADLIFPYVKSVQAFDCPNAEDRMTQNTSLNPPRFFRDAGGSNPATASFDCVTGVALNKRNFNYGVNAYTSPTSDPAFRGPFLPVIDAAGSITSMTTLSEMPAPASVVGIADGVSPSPWSLSGGSAYNLVNVTNQVAGQRHTNVPNMRPGNVWTMSDAG